MRVRIEHERIGICGQGRYHLVRHPAAQALCGDRVVLVSLDVSALQNHLDDKGFCPACRHLVELVEIGTDAIWVHLATERASIVLPVSARTLTQAAQAEASASNSLTSVCQRPLTDATWSQSVQYLPPGRTA